MTRPHILITHLFLDAILFTLLLLPAFVSAHGYVGSVTIEGTTYAGNAPAAAQPTGSVIREVSTISPVKGATNENMNCGMDSEFAEDVAPANPGDQIQIWWVGNGGAHWPHNTGPLMTYMTACQGDCTSYNATSAEWFKIDQVGKMTDSTWYQQLVSDGAPINVTLPKTLAAGSYLIRTEIIALQLAVSVGGAEFYPACIQIKVGGSESGGPQSDEVVQFPGTGGWSYTDTDPGIYDVNVYDPGSTYTFPGPPIAQFAEATASNPGVDVNGTSSSSSGSSSNSTSSSSSSSGDSSTSSTVIIPSSPSTTSSSLYYTPSSYPSTQVSSSSEPISTIPTTGTSSSTPGDGGSSSSNVAVCKLTPSSSSTGGYTRRALRSLHWKNLVPYVSF